MDVNGYNGCQTTIEGKSWNGEHFEDIYWQIKYSQGGSRA